MIKILISIAVAASLLSACSGFNQFRLDVQQGNVIDATQVAQIQPGMTRQQVRFLMGSPQIDGAFKREDRWDYVYYRRPGIGPTEQRRVTVFFENGVVSYVDSDVPQPVALDEYPVDIDDN
ncbi:MULTISPECIES: outer membrane protein assembly factor BamE [unclassified Thioalkalivibrio]|uniref:outer membrane protein assembly factor BamE n=1 Tax=unclassified Thioalkalivibrio TaxID=2621013 RepID=UPI0003673170|nr:MULTISPECIES: outer membrane protein assembly factor BamE [unclassified Thioalkalivibrio]